MIQIWGGHPIDKSFGAGPMEAVEEFIKDNRDFEIDRTKERFLLTGNPEGFLRKKLKGEKRCIEVSEFKKIN